MPGRDVALAAPRHQPPGVGARRQLLISCGVAVVVLVVVSVGAVFACRTVARNQAFADAERMTSRLGDYVVGPLLSAALVPGAPQRSELYRTFRDRADDGYLVEAMVWDADGRIIWSSDPSIIDVVVPIPEEATAAINQGTISSGFADRAEVTHTGQVVSVDGFVEVYVPFTHSAHPGLAFEAYYNYARVNDTADQLTRQMLPLALVPLLLLQLIQMPIVFSLTRRLRRQEVERSSMLEHNLLISDRERVRIAADLHDGPIQDLAGIGYALNAIAPAVLSQHLQLMSNVQDAVQRSSQLLRRMMVDLYPPDLRANHLPDTIDSLATPLRGAGIDVQVTVGELPELAGDTVEALYRITREALANVAHHSHASTVHVGLEPGGTGEHGTVELRISDNGVGLDPRRLDRRADGHLGLRLLIDRIRILGGTLDIETGHSGGTTLRAVLPTNGPRPVPHAARH